MERVPGDGDAPGELPRWKLGDLYDSPQHPSVEADLDWVGKACLAFASRFEGKLSELSGDGLADALSRCEEIRRRSHRLGLYAHLRHEQDTLEPSRAKFVGDIDSRLTELTRPLVFFRLELNTIEDETLQRQLAESAALRRYRAWLTRLRAFRPHQLPNLLEEYVHDHEPVGSSAWSRLFGETTAAMTFEVGGEALSLEPTLNLLLDADREKRQEAWEALASEFSGSVRLFTRIMNTLVKAKEIDDRWRKYPSPQTPRHLANAIEPEIVEALRDAVVEAYPRISHRYYAMKARWLGFERLESWDRNAPLSEEGDRKYGWDEAREIVLDAYSEFSSVFGAVAGRFFEEGWIDAPAVKGKAPGAFSAMGPVDVHPFVLLNYLGRTRDVTTLAHELGHGVHQVLASEQGELLARTPLTFAETASVFGEMLTFRGLLDQETDRARRKALLVGKAEDMINTVVRQISFYEFESRVHESRRDGELTAADFGKIWLETARESLGPAMRLNEGYENFWCYVPHFIHSPFYVYAYAFGDGLVNTLYALHRRGEANFVENYIEMLRAGGSRLHGELLAPFGLDLREPGFWRAGLDVISDTIDEAEALED